MKRITTFLKLLIWLLMSERQKVNATLRVRYRNAFLHPSQMHSPTVDYQSRCALEQFKDIKLDSYLPGLSESYRALVLSAFRGLIGERTYSDEYPMQCLDGFTNSKSSMNNNKYRASQPTMAAMGKIVNDLSDLEGKAGQDVIDACFEWSELRLERGINLLTDSWHKRYYWSNSGGSHHMAVLCYELQRQGKQWNANVNIHEYTLNLTSLDQLTGKVSIFVLMRDDETYINEQVFETLPLSLRNYEVAEGLGVSVPHTNCFQLPFSKYQVVLVDHSKKYSDIVIDRLTKATESGMVMTFQQFLSAWVDLKKTNELCWIYDS